MKPKLADVADGVSIALEHFMEIAHEEEEWAATGFDRARMVFSGLTTAGAEIELRIGDDRYFVEITKRRK